MVVLVKEGVRADACEGSAGYEMIGFCPPGPCVAFVCALFLHYPIGEGGESPVVFAAAGWAST